jgi:hypothetical protein
MSGVNLRLEASIRAMQDYFPDFSLSIQMIGSGNIAVWKGKVQPIQSLEGLNELLDDIHCERPIHVMPGGEVRHHPTCTITHAHHDWMDKLKNPCLSFELEVRYNGGRRHPKAFIRAPVLPQHKWKHLFTDGSICPYAPWENIWRWDLNTVGDYMGHALAWLIKWIVWDQADIWIGPEKSHDRNFLLQNIGRNQKCWCGSGEKYKRCHLAQDETSLRQSTIQR